MKPETRILVSHCTSNICAGLVTRGPGFDGVAIARDCQGLCRRLEEQGFTGELRYYYGSCSCGLEEYTGDYRMLELVLFLRRLLSSLERLEKPYE
ncbi:MAG: hypothetical protein GSR78_00060 [Desulfurococcales archaeon]|nr:hypothetical protein [Desulfurococcales archaeon]